MSLLHTVTQRTIARLPRLAAFSSCGSRPCLRGLTSLALVGLLASAGCSKKPDRVKTYAAHGTVLLDGAPLAGAFVVLHPANPSESANVPVRGQTNAEGRYSLTTYDANDGAPAGNYLVTVAQYSAVTNGQSVEPGPNVLSPRYAARDKTELRVLIAEQKNEIPTLTLTK